MYTWKTVQRCPKQLICPSVIFKSCFPSDCSIYIPTNSVCVPFSPLHEMSIHVFAHLKMSLPIKKLIVIFVWTFRNPLCSSFMNSSQFVFWEADMESEKCEFY